MKKFMAGDVGRPPHYNTRMTWNLMIMAPEEWKDAMYNYANGEGITIGSLVRTAIEEYFDKRKRLLRL